MIFQFLEINEKKISFIMKNEKKKKFEQKNFDGLLPILYCERRMLKKKKLYCRTPRVYCKIVSAVGSVVLQCNTVGLDRRLCHNTKFVL